MTSSVGLARDDLARGGGSANGYGNGGGGRQRRGAGREVVREPSEYIQRREPVAVDEAARGDWAWRTAGDALAAQRDLAASADTILLATAHPTAGIRVAARA